MSFNVAQSNPSAASLTDLYVAPSGKEAVVSTLAIAEHGGDFAQFDVLVSPSGAAASDTHILIKDGQLGAKDTLFFTIGIALAPTDVIRVKASTADVTFTAFVNESEV